MCVYIYTRIRTCVCIICVCELVYKLSRRLWKSMVVSHVRRRSLPLHIPLDFSVYRAKLAFRCLYTGPGPAGASTPHNIAYSPISTKCINSPYIFVQLTSFWLNLRFFVSPLGPWCIYPHHALHTLDASGRVFFLFFLFLLFGGICVWTAIVLAFDTRHWLSNYTRVYCAMISANNLKRCSMTGLLRSVCACTRLPNDCVHQGPDHAYERLIVMLIKCAV